MAYKLTPIRPIRSTGRNVSQIRLSTGRGSIEHGSTGPVVTLWPTGRPMPVVCRSTGRVPLGTLLRAVLGTYSAYEGIVPGAVTPIRSTGPAPPVCFANWSSHNTRSGQLVGVPSDCPSTGSRFVLLPLGPH